MSADELKAKLEQFFGLKLNFTDEKLGCFRELLYRSPTDKEIFGIKIFTTDEGETWQFGGLIHSATIHWKDLCHITD